MIISCRSIPILRRVVVLFVILASLCLESWPASAKDGWSLEGQGTLFYTDDVGLVSATRWLSRDGDPTQPAIDSKLTDKGSDMVFEPLLNVSRPLTNGLGQLDLNMRGQGFVFTDNPEFNHATLRIQAIQALSLTTRVKARYYTLGPTGPVQHPAAAQQTLPSRGGTECACPHAL